MEDLKNTIYHYLENYCQGRDRAIKLDELGNRISLEQVSWRHIAEAVELLRKEGKPIASCAKGIFMPITVDEKKSCLRTIYRRALHTLETARALEKAFGRQIVEEVSQEFNELSNGQLESKFLCEVR